MRRAIWTAFSVGRREGFVHRVGVEGLGAAENGRERLHGGADDVVLGLLGGEGGAAGLGMEAEHLGARVLRFEPVAHDAGPEAAGGAELGDFLEEVVVAGEEEAEAAGEVVDVEAGADGRLDVGDAVGEGEGDLLGGGAAGLAHVVAGDGDGVPLRHVVSAVGRRCR
nr:hypothetical protein [Tepidiforma sp.]